MEFSFENPSSFSSSSSNSNHLASKNFHSSRGPDRDPERLKKAIERNRLKQAKRQGKRQDKLTRKSVGRAGEQEFTGQLKRASTSSSVSSVPVSYTSSRPVVKKKRVKNIPVKSLGPRGGAKKSIKSSSKSSSFHGASEYIAKGIWLFYGILLVRLIFSNGGVQDYYAKKDLLEWRFQEQARIERENRELLKEIQLLKKNPHYQRKVVRDNLGYIASDEFLILFPEG